MVHKNVDEILSIEQSVLFVDYIATRDIQPGEVVFTDAAVAIGIHPFFYPVRQSCNFKEEENERPLALEPCPPLKRYLLRPSGSTRMFEPQVSHMSKNFNSSFAKQARK